MCVYVYTRIFFLNSSLGKIFTHLTLPLFVYNSNLIPDISSLSCH